MLSALVLRLGRKWIMTQRPSHRDPAETYASMLTEAAVAVLQAHHSLFTAGELVLLSRWMALSPVSRRLHAHLIFRVDRIHPWKQLGCHQSVGVELVETGLGEWSHSIQPLPRLTAVASRLEIAALAGVAKSTRENKTRLIARAAEALVGLRRKPRFRLRHRRIFERILRLYCLRPGRSHQAWVLQAHGLRRYPTGGPRPALRRFENRRQMLCSEQAHPWPDTPLPALDATAIIERMERYERHLDHPLCPLSGWSERLAGTIRKGSHDQVSKWATRAWTALRASDPWMACELAPNLARALYDDGKAKEAERLCIEARSLSTTRQTLILVGMQKRQARRWKRPRPEPVLFRRARQRRIRLKCAPIVGRRPRFLVSDGAHYAEDAVIALLSTVGRQALFCENHAWAILTAGILSDLIVQHLPAPALSCPPDYGHGQFYRRLMDEIEHRLSRVAQGETPRMLTEALRRYGGTRLGGRLFDQGTTANALYLARHFPGPFVASVLRERIRAPRDLSRGMPDLVVLPGTNSRLPPGAAVPREFPAGPFWIEVKTRHDTARPAQVSWHDRLLALGQHVELWDLREAHP